MQPSWWRDQGYPSADGSLVNDGDYVYVLPLYEIREVDYFHGTIDGEGPIAQMVPDEVDIFASEMFSTRHDGRTVRAIITLQRRWRKKRLRSRIHTARMMLQHTARTQADRMALRAWWIRSRFFG